MTFFDMFLQCRSSKWSSFPIRSAMAQTPALRGHATQVRARLHFVTHTHKTVYKHTVMSCIAYNYHMIISHSLNGSYITKAFAYWSLTWTLWCTNNNFCGSLINRSAVRAARRQERRFLRRGLGSLLRMWVVDIPNNIIFKPFIINMLLCSHYRLRWKI